MNKSELVHEIYKFDKELTDYGLKKEIKLHNNYYLSFGTLHRKIGNNTIFVSNLTTYNKEKELLAFYETFFHDLDTLDEYRDGNSYFEKLLNYIKRKTAYDKFELVHSGFDSRGDYNSIEYHFKDNYNRKFLPESKAQKEALENKHQSFKIYNFLYWFSLAVFVAVIFVVAVFLFTGKTNIFYNPFLTLALILGISSNIYSKYVYANVEKYRTIADDMIYEIGDFAKLNKRNYYKDIYQFYKDDLFFKELQKQYNINTTPTGNQIIGD